MTNNKLSKQEMRKILGGDKVGGSHACIAMTTCRGNTTISVICDDLCFVIQGQSVSCTNKDGSGASESCGNTDIYLD